MESFFTQTLLTNYCTRDNRYYNPTQTKVVSNVLGGKLTRNGNRYPIYRKGSSEPLLVECYEFDGKEYAIMSEQKPNYYNFFKNIKENFTVRDDYAVETHRVNYRAFENSIKKKLYTAPAKEKTMNMTMYTVDAKK
jgi:hypothetical protein